MMKYLYTLVLLFVSTFVFAQVDSTLCNHIGEDPRYVDLMERHRVYGQREDSLRMLLTDARARYTELKENNHTKAELEKLSSQILNLEREVLDIRSRQRGVVSSIANLEQRYIINKKDGVISEESGSTEVKNVGVEHIRLINNEIITRSLSGDSYTDLKRAQREDSLLPSLVEEYIANYKRMGRCVEEYDAATKEKEGDAIYENYLAVRRRVDSLGGVIERYWSHILNVKYYAYGYILECNGRLELLQNSSIDFSNMQQICAGSNGKYQSDALAHYALGRPTLVAFEYDFAKEMGLNLAADSLQRVLDAIVAPEYKLEPIVLERRSFVVYEPLVIAAKSIYSDSNPIPELPVYENGTIYRVSFGSYKSAQQGSTFKGAQPLYVAKENGGYIYYAAGYATEEEASKAVEQLEAKGFKELHICCWTDGSMKTVRSTKSESAEPETASPSSNKRYTLVLECSKMTDDMSATIRKVAPDKRISRRSTGFAVSGFTSRKDAEKLQKALAQSYPNVKTTITESSKQ